ncbi:uncharacterized protein LOC141666017 [Apium graveolens]|uniref:uncharacterized protein LOC141666017 n=1 Tax=Apium graveolens TaxID=4045 RepID=UPI003D796E35
MVQKFFDTGVFEVNITDTNIVLIPKKQTPKTMADLRPISLCNVVYKVASKVLGNRLKEVIGLCVTSVKYKIWHSGRKFGEIVPKRGLRQGDPLSSYLFLICIEGFPSILKKYECQAMLGGIRVARGAPSITHMLFVDDSYIFCKADTKEASRVVSLLQMFEKASGQKINEQKSSVFFSRNVSSICRREVCTILKFTEADESSHYLGLRNCIGQKKSTMLGYIKEKVSERVQTWDGKVLVADKYTEEKKHPLDVIGADVSIEISRKTGVEAVDTAESLVARVYKARYYPRGNFLNAQIGGNPSFIWRSVIETQSIIKEGIGYRVGSGESISVKLDPWLLDDSNPYVTTANENLSGMTMSSLIIEGESRWNVNMLHSLFDERDVNLILSIPLNRNEHDVLYWRKEKLGCYSVKSTYVQIQEKKDVQATGPNLSDGQKKRQQSAMLCWAIWKSINDIVWNRHNTEVLEVVAVAKVVLNQWKYAQDKTFHPTLSFLNEEDVDERWMIPQENKIKVNCDAAIFEETNTYSYAFIRRDHAGAVLEAKSVYRMGNIVPENAEAIGVREALSWIKE